MPLRKLISTVCLMALISCGLPAAWAVTVSVDPVGYHPKAPKLLTLTELPSDLKQPAVIQVVDPADLDPVFLKPKTVYKAPISGRRPTGEWILPLTDFQKPGTYQLRVAGQLVSPGFTITPSRYWMTVTRQLATVKQLENAPPKCSQLACETEAEYLAHSSLGWRTDGKARQKLATPNALAVLMLMQWHQINPKIQQSLRVGSSENFDGESLLDITASNLRWLMDLVTPRKGVRSGIQWSPDSRCYTLMPVDTVSTLTTIAALGKAAQVYKKPDLGFAVKCLMTAEDLWQQLPNTLPPSQAHLLSLAAAELWIATKKPVYEKAFWQSLQRVPPTPYSAGTPLALGVSDILRLQDSLTPDQKSTLSQWLSHPLPQLDTVDHLTQRLLVALTLNDQTALDQVSSHLPVKTPDNKLLTQTQWIWMHGVLNELYNRVPEATATEEKINTRQSGETAQSMLSRWAAKRERKTASH